MTTPNPETLTELLKTLERSAELRSLARECGLSVRELRRRLAIWRRELVDEEEADGKPGVRKAAGKGSRKGGKKGDDKGDWPELIAAADLEKSPIPAKGRGVLEVFTDGASRGNPGPAAVGIVFRVKGGPEVAQHSETIGKATNNVAEYAALIAALTLAAERGVDKLVVYSDSQLLVRQVNGAYRVKAPHLRPIFLQALKLRQAISDFTIEHVGREDNKKADGLANQAIDQRAALPPWFEFEGPS